MPRKRGRGEELPPEPPPPPEPEPEPEPGAPLDESIDSKNAPYALVDDEEADLLQSQAPPRAKKPPAKKASAPPPIRRADAEAAAARPPLGPRSALIFSAIGAALAVVASVAVGYALHRRQRADLTAERDREVARVERELRDARTAADEASRTSASAAEARARELERLMAELAAATAEARAARAAAEEERRRRVELEDALAAAGRLRDEQTRALAALEARLAAERAELEKARAEAEARAKALEERLKALEARAKADVDRAKQEERRRAEAEAARREQDLRAALEAERVRVEAERKAAEEARLKLEERLKAEAEAERGGFIKEPREGAEPSVGEGIDLEKEVFGLLSGNLGGSAEYRLYAYFQEGEQEDAERVLNQGIFKLRYAGRFLADALEVVAVPRVRVDDGGLSRGTPEELEDDDLRRPVFTFEEAFAGVTFGPVDIRAGKQIFAFGAADLFNPTDVVNPVDFTDLLDTEKIGVLALDASLYLGALIPALPEDTRLRGIVVPTFTPARLGPADSRFAPLPPDFPLPVAARETEPDTPRNAQLLGRFETTLLDVNVSFSYYYGFNDLPNVRFEPLPVAPSFFVQPFFDRIQMFGGDATTVIADVEVHGEVAYIITDGPLDDDYVQFVVGADYTFYDLISDHDLTVVAEYAGEVIVRESARGEDFTSPTQFARALSNSALVRVAYKPTNDLEALVAAAVTFDRGESYFIRPEVRYRIGDHSKVAVGVDILGGPDDTLFGQFDREDRFFASLKLSF